VTRPMAVGTVHFGDRNGNAKLTEAEVRQIIAALKQVPRRSQRSIAEEFGVSGTHVGRIARRQSWSILWEDQVSD